VTLVNINNDDEAETCVPDLNQREELTHLLGGILSVLRMRNPFPVALTIQQAFRVRIETTGRGMERTV